MPIGYLAKLFHPLWYRGVCTYICSETRKGQPRPKPFTPPLKKVTLSQSPKPLCTFSTISTLASTFFGGRLLRSTTSGKLNSALEALYFFALPIAILLNCVPRSYYCRPENRPKWQEKRDLFSPARLHHPHSPFL